MNTMDERWPRTKPRQNPDSRARLSWLRLALCGCLLGSCGGFGADLTDFGWGHMAAASQVNGSRPLLVILANFVDGHFDRDAAYFDAYTFGGIQGQPSIAGYYSEVSAGRFTWTRAGVIKVDLGHTERYTNQLSYVGPNSADKVYTSNIVYRAMAANLNVFISHGADGNHSMNEREMAIAIITNDGGGASRHTGLVQYNGYKWDGVVAILDYRGEFATFCHELAHQLGTIDLYGFGGYNFGLTIMCGTVTLDFNNPATYFDPSTYHLDPWHKLQLGWLEPRIRSLRQSSTESLAADQEGDPGAPILLWDPQRGASEFFLLEHRSSASSRMPNYDANVPGKGLAIWHVQQDADKNYRFLADAVYPNSENHWWFCVKCRGLFYSGSASGGKCPAGNAHSSGLTSTGDYRLLENDPQAPGQSGWHICGRCYGLFFGDPSLSHNHCPSGLPHQAVTGCDYTLAQTSTAIGEHGWRWCGKCGGLFLPDYAAKSDGTCPLGGAHDGASSGDYAVAKRWAQFTVGAEASPDLNWSGSQLWGPATDTPVLRWFDGSSAGVRLHVRAFNPDDTNILVDWGQTEIWVDFNHLLGWGEISDGSFDHPFVTLEEGINNLFAGGLIHIKAGHSPTRPTIDKPMRIEANGGVVTLGR